MRVLLSRRRRQAGLSLVELMVGITIGLIVVAGASLMMTNQVSENTRLLVETQLQQDLRAAADLMLRDIRRAGYWSGSDAGVWLPSGAGGGGNIYSPTSQAVVDDSKFYYAYANGGTPTTVPAARESFGFKRDTATNGKGNVVGVLYSITGNVFDNTAPVTSFHFPTGATLNPAPQPITDPDTVNITSFKVNLIEQPASAASAVSPPCPATAPTCPCLIVRRVDITIEGESANDAKVKRTLSVSSRIRNDQLVQLAPASCP